MKLTRVERWLLSNQYQILEMLRPEEADHYAQHREALESGYELSYGWACEHIYADTMSREQCKEVLDIMDMFTALQRAYKQLGTAFTLTDQDVTFAGFDGNDETMHMAYARYLRESGKWSMLECSSGDLNSHMPTLDRYRRMLEEWRASEDRNELSGEDVVRIVAAQ